MLVGAEWLGVTARSAHSPGRPGPPPMPAPPVPPVPVYAEPSGTPMGVEEL